MFFEKSDLDNTKLPTKRDIIQYYLFLKHEGESTSRISKNKKLSFYTFFVGKKLFELWHRAKIPTIVLTALRNKLGKLLQRYNDIIKNPSKYHAEEWDRLFQIAKCTCGIEFNMNCICVAQIQIPANIKDFFVDQCGPRLLSLDELGDDEPVQNLFEDVSIQSTSGLGQPSTSTAGYVPFSSDEEEYEACQRELSPTIDSPLKVSDISLRHFSSALNRTNTSNRSGALLATSMINDLRKAIENKANKELPLHIAAKVIHFFDDLIIDKSKIQRERRKFEIQAATAAKMNTLLKGISFDGKKEMSLKKVTVQNKPRNVKVTEEHVTIVKEPESKFIGYVTPEAGTGEGIQKAIVDFLNKERYCLDHLLAINCDGTVTNTGYKNGVIPFLERYLRRPLQWLVCLFHFNELPLTALLTHFTGKAKGPKTWPGEFGEEIVKCENFPVSVDFDLT